MGKPLHRWLHRHRCRLWRELFYAGDFVIKKGDWITIDGGSGEVMEGQVNTLPPATESGVVQEFLTWAMNMPY